MTISEFLGLVTLAALAFNIGFGRGYWRGRRSRF